jgi:hypothetical protein
LQVEADAAGAPRTVRFQGALRPVAAVQDRWRIDDEWWRERPVSRLYYQLQLEGGPGTPAGVAGATAVITVYRDLIEGDWWLQRY